jgi:multidrug efflux pump subunit AcrB
MWITKVSINNPVFATMVMVGLCVLGIFSYGKLGVEQLPDITIPVVTISVIYPGASPEAVENDITKPIENAVNAVAGIKTLRSSSFEGDSARGQGTAHRTCRYRERPTGGAAGRHLEHARPEGTEHAD